MQFPQLNMNGTSGSELLDQLKGALTAIRAAREAVAKTIPHGRDYQTLNVEAYSTARDEHYARCRALAAVQQDLEELAGNVCEQHYARQKRDRQVQLIYAADVAEETVVD